MDVAAVGPVCFGAVVGWTAHAAYADAPKVSLQWLAATIGVVGGGAVTALFKSDELFGAYSIGMAMAFFFRMFLFSPLVIRISEWVDRKVFRRGRVPKPGKADGQSRVVVPDVPDSAAQDD